MMMIMALILSTETGLHVVSGTGHARLFRRSGERNESACGFVCVHASVLTFRALFV